MNETSSVEVPANEFPDAARDEVVDQYRTSGMTQKAFCQQRGLSLRTLRRWLYRWPGANPPSDFSAAVPLQEIPLGSLLERTAWSAELILPNGATLRLSSEVACQVLTPWLGRQSC